MKKSARPARPWWQRSCGYIVQARPREDGATSVVYVNPATATIVLSGAGEELRAHSEKLIALAEQLAWEQAAVIYRTWRHADYTELVELYRVPSTGWHARTKQPTEAF